MVRKEIEDLVENLRGTISAMSSACEDLGIDELTQEEIEFIDNEIMCCANCGWWVETSDMKTSENDEQVCSDCKYEESDYDSDEDDD